MQSTDKLMSKLTEIFSIIKSIEEDNQDVSAMLLQGLSTSMRLVEQIAVRDSKVDAKAEINVDEQLTMVSKALGFQLEDLVMHIVQTNFPAGPGSTLDASNKDPDLDTLEFITSDLDDYEKFLAESKTKQSLDFLKDQI